MSPINKTTTLWQKRIRLFTKDGEFFFINSSLMESIAGLHLSDDCLEELCSVSMMLEDHLNENWQPFILDKIYNRLADAFQKEFNCCFNSSETVLKAFTYLFYQDSVYHRYNESKKAKGYSTWL